MSIAQALSAVMLDVSHVGKTEHNKHGGYSFRGIDAVMNAVGPALRKHGVVVLPHLDSIEWVPVQTSTGKTQTACRVTVTYTFVGPDGDPLSATVPGESWDSGDKAVPQAMSVAFRTCLLQTLCLPTDEPDPDSFHHEIETVPELDLSGFDTAFVDTLDLDKLRAHAGQSAAHHEQTVRILEDRQTEWLAGVAS